ncbi:hypothetical protein AVEN_228602-1, partial [Araneus ventricosus]
MKGCQKSPTFIELTLSSSVIISSPTALSQLPNKQITTKETWRIVLYGKEVSNQQQNRKESEEILEKDCRYLNFLAIFCEFPGLAALSQAAKQ